MPFAPGNNANPKGGNTAGYEVAQRMRRQFLADFKRNGMGAIQDLRERDPGKYLQIGVSLMPKEIQHSMDAGFSDVLLAAAQHLALQHKQEEKELPTIEGEVITQFLPDNPDSS